MTPEEQNDTIIRIDTRVNDMANDLSEALEFIKQAPCQVSGEKIKTLERLTWGAICTSCVALLGFFVRYRGGA